MRYLFITLFLLLCSGCPNGYNGSSASSHCDKLWDEAHGVVTSPERFSGDPSLSYIYACCSILAPVKIEQDYCMRLLVFNETK